MTRKRNHKGNNGNGNFFRIGTCPVCGQENVPLTEHHIYKRSVFGESEKKFSLCRRCHDKIEFINRTWENMVLRSFQSCYRELFNSFLRGERKEEDEDELIAALEPYVLQGFKKIEKRGINPWLKERIVKKGIYIRSKSKRENNGH
ncbi:MAG TPA: hypothetical protein PLV95_00890 [Candidatus Pacearchaeota archaeon]|nr:hypothetical protein [Candidatus Pacearchaeota archaeon]